MPLSESLAQSATAAAAMQMQIDAIARNVAALQAQPQGPPVQSGSGHSQVIHVQDGFGAKLDGSTDDTAAIQKALDKVGTPGAPATVFIPACVCIAGPLHFSFPGTRLLGEGLIGQGQHDAICTVIQARDSAADQGPAFVFDPSMMPVPRQWARSGGLDHVSFDVSHASRFTSDPAPPAAVSYRGVSTPPEQTFGVYGNIGAAIEVTCNPAVQGAISENITFRNCVVYGGHQSLNGLPNTNYSSRMPTAPLVHVIGGDNIRFEGGLYARGFATMPPQVYGDLRDVPAFLFEPLITPSLMWPGHFYMNGVAITNMPVAVRSMVADWNGGIYGPTGVIRDIIVENFNRAIELGVGNTSGAFGFSRPQNFIVDGGFIGGNFPWYGGHTDTCLTVFVDKAQGAKINIAFLGFDGDVTFSPNAIGCSCVAGINPWGGDPKPVDLSGRNTFVDLWKPAKAG